MSLNQELGLKQPVQKLEHEALMSLLYTALQLNKEGYRLLRPYGLTDSQFNLLMLLKHQGEEEGLTQTRLGEMLLVNRSNVTGLIDRLEKLGLAKRDAQPGDRRVNSVRLTDAGRELLDQAETIYYDRVQEIMGALNEREQRQLIRLLERIRTQVS